MKRSKFPHLIGLHAEQALILAAQQGSKEAASILVRLDYDFIRDLAQKRTRRIIHRPDIRTDLDDMIGIGVCEYLHKVRTYNAEKSCGCRMRNYAYLDMQFAMQQHACDGLEIVPLAGGHKVHAAHKDIEAGMCPSEVQKKHGLKLDVVRSLHRGTVSLSKLQEEDAEPGSPELNADKFDGRVVAARAWEMLDDVDRSVLDEIRLEPNLQDRARAAGNGIVDQRGLERRAFRRAREALRLAQEIEDLEPVELAVRPGVWPFLGWIEREVVSLHWLGVVNPSQKAASLSQVAEQDLTQADALELERRTWQAVRRLASTL